MLVHPSSADNAWHAADAAVTVNVGMADAAESADAAERAWRALKAEDALMVHSKVAVVRQQALRAPRVRRRRRPEIATASATAVGALWRDLAQQEILSINAHNGAAHLLQPRVRKRDVVGADSVDCALDEVEALMHLSPSKAQSRATEPLAKRARYVTQRQLAEAEWNFGTLSLSPLSPVTRGRYRFNRARPACVTLPGEDTSGDSLHMKSPASFLPCVGRTRLGGRPGWRRTPLASSTLRDIETDLDDIDE